MGSAVDAKCDCGVAATILVGGGAATFMKICYFPGLCRNCCKVVQLDLFAKECRCPDCGGTDVIAYDDPSLSKTVGARVVAYWGVEDRLGKRLELTDGTYECPSCGRLSLRFTEGFCWD